MNKKITVLFFLAIFLFNAQAWAHFVELTANRNFLANGNEKAISLEMAFTHPFENGPLMTMKRPISFGVLHRGKKNDIIDNLQEIDGFKDLKWTYTQKLKQLGDYIFYVSPVPYFEPVENKFIIHYTKTVISHGGGGRWDDLIGFPVEIRPLTRPYGLWTNNIFRGLVLKDGKPVPFAEIEIEFKNNLQIKAPNDSYITQVVKADAHGVFAHNLPKAGWWGFAALIEDGDTMKTENGQEYVIEKGALIWIKAEDMK